MGRHRKPTALLERAGSFKHDPQRKRVEPKPRGPLGNPPVYFTDHQKEVWWEVEAMMPLGVLTTADRSVMEDFVLLKWKKRCIDRRLFDELMAVVPNNLLDEEPETMPPGLSKAKQQIWHGKQIERQHRTRKSLQKLKLSLIDWSNANAQALQWYYSHFGMTPVDRAKIDVSKSKKDNPFASFGAKVKDARRKGAEEIERKQRTTDDDSEPSAVH
jgi:hypothetical protein